MTTDATGEAAGLAGAAESAGGSGGTGPAGVPRAAHSAGWTVWALEHLRQSMGLGHQAFAAYLERSETWWSRVRNGQQTISADRLRFIVQLRPWMAQFVALDYLADGRNAVVGTSSPGAGDGG